MEIGLGLRRSVEILGTAPLELGRYMVKESIGHQPDPDRSKLATVITLHTVSSDSEERRPRVFQAYTDIDPC